MTPPTQTIDVEIRADTTQFDRSIRRSARHARWQLRWRGHTERVLAATAGVALYNAAVYAIGLLS